MLSKQKSEDEDQKYPIRCHLLKKGVKGFSFDFLKFILLLSFYGTKPIRAPLLLSLAADFEPHLCFKAGGKPQNRSRY